MSLKRRPGPLHVALGAPASAVLNVAAADAVSHGRLDQEARDANDAIDDHKDQESA